MQYDNTQYKENGWHLYNERIIPMNGKEKEWLYYMKYNIKMIDNIEMKIINIEGKKKIAYIAKGNDTWYKISIIEHRI